MLLSRKGRLGTPVPHLQLSYRSRRMKLSRRLMLADAS